MQSTACIYRGSYIQPTDRITLPTTSEAETKAAAVGKQGATISSSKDDLVIGKYDLFGDRMAGALDARPLEEPIRASLRRMFDITLDYVQDDRQRARK